MEWSVCAFQHAVLLVVKLVAVQAAGSGGLLGRVEAVLLAAVTPVAQPVIDDKGAPGGGPVGVVFGGMDLAGEGEGSVSPSFFVVPSITIGGHPAVHCVVLVGKEVVQHGGMVLVCSAEVPLMEGDDQLGTSLDVIQEYANKGFDVIRVTRREAKRDPFREFFQRSVQFSEDVVDSVSQRVWANVTNPGAGGRGSVAGGVAAGARGNSVARMSPHVAAAQAHVKD